MQMVQSFDFKVIVTFYSEEFNPANMPDTNDKVRLVDTSIDEYGLYTFTYEAEMEGEEDSKYWRKEIAKENLIAHLSNVPEYEIEEIH